MSKYGHNKTTKKKKAWDVKEPKSFADSAPIQRVDLIVEDFDRLIEQKGVNVKVYRTTYCPNVKSIDGAEHEIDCPMCNGSGWIDRNPVCAKSFFQNQDLERIMDNASGQIDGNSVLATFPIGIELQYFTLVQLEDFTDIYFERIMRKSTGPVDVLKYKACRVNMIIAKDGSEYYADQDFKIDPNGNILWLNTVDNSGPTPVYTYNRAPAANMVYSIHYECHVQFRAIRAMHVNRFTQYKAAGEPLVQHIKMQEQWLLSKEFLVRRKDLNGQDLLQGPFNTHVNGTDEND